MISTGKKSGPTVAVLGTLDGVHLGHRELIRQGRVLADRLGAKLRVVTFDRHPLEVLRPEAAPKLLQTAAEREETLSGLGVEEIRVIPFTRETAETEPEDFLRQLREECDLAAAVAGWNYSFGRKGRGDAALLREDGRKHGYEVRIVPPVRTEDGEVISSTAIREKLLRGDLEGANRMLGYAYMISGTVVNGKHQGTRIGFPTANIETEAGKLLPAYGVYACRMESGEQAWPGVVNIGLQPTLPSGRVTVEAHALHAEVDLYGRQARVRLLRYLRPERRFSSVEELTEQIARDRREAEDIEKACHTGKNEVV